jgi:hypothetical protein
MIFNILTNSFHRECRDQAPVLHNLSPCASIDSTTTTFIPSVFIVFRGASSNLHSPTLDMVALFSTGLFWPSKSRVRHLSFLELHAQHFKMHCGFRRITRQRYQTDLSTTERGANHAAQRTVVHRAVLFHYFISEPSQVPNVC